MKETIDKRRGSGQRGAQMVEFALGFLIFLVLVVGIFEGGRLVWTYDDAFTCRTPGRADGDCTW